MNISIVPTEHVNDVWGTVADIISPAVVMSEGRYLVEDVRLCILKCEMQLWIAFNDNREINGCVITRISEYPSRRLLYVAFIAGKKVRSWAGPMIETVTRWAEDNQCSGIESGGRKGWIKLIKPYGFSRGFDSFKKDF